MPASPWRSSLRRDKVVVGGEITSKAEVDGRRIVAGRNQPHRLHHGAISAEIPHDLLELEVCLHEQSPDISAAVGKTQSGAIIGAGDQGIVVGYATNETEEYLPLPVVLAHRICKQAGRTEAGESRGWARTVRRRLLSPMRTTCPSP